MSQDLRAELSTSLAASVFLASTLTVFGPYHSYVANYTELPVLLRHIVPYLAALFGLVVVVVLSALFITIKRSWHPRFVTFVFALALLMWLQGNIFVWDYGVLNETNLNWERFRIIGLAELAAWYLVARTAFVSLVTRQKLIRDLSIALIVVQSVVVLAVQIQGAPDPYWLRTELDTDHESAFRYSPDQNVVLVVLDGFPSFVFQRIVEEDPSFGEIFNGFTYFRNAVSGYPFTMGSVPNILTGQFFDNSQPYPDFVRAAYVNDSLPSTLSEHGYQADAFEFQLTTVFNPVFSNSVPRQFSSTRRVESVDLLLRITAFRSLPHYLKSMIPIFDLQNPMGLSETEAPLDLINSVVDRLYVDGPGPTFKFYHLLIPHEPFSLNEDLELESLENDTLGFVRHSTAALRLMERLLDVLQNSGIYDNTLLLIVGDHGYPTELGPPLDSLEPAIGDLNPAFFRALPLVLAKPLGSTGPLKVSDAPVHLMDIPRTVLTAVGIENDAPGLSMFQSDVVDGRVRRFLLHDWEPGTTGRHREWESRLYMPPLREFFVDGFSWSGAAWRSSGSTFERD